MHGRGNGGVVAPFSMLHAELGQGTGPSQEMHGRVIMGGEFGSGSWGTLYHL